MLDITKAFAPFVFVRLQLQRIKNNDEVDDVMLGTSSKTV